VDGCERIERTQRGRAAKELDNLVADLVAITGEEPF